MWPGLSRTLSRPADNIHISTCITENNGSPRPRTISRALDQLNPPFIHCVLIDCCLTIDPFRVRSGEDMTMGRRIWVRRICLPLLLAVALLVAAAVPAPQHEGFWRPPLIDWSALWSWLGPPP